MLLGASLVLGVTLAACDVVPELPCWAEVRADYRAVELADPVTPTTLAEATGIIDARLEAYGIVQRSVFTWGIDRISVGLEEGDATEEVRELIGATGRLRLVPIPPGMGEVAPGDRLPPGLPALVEHEQLVAVTASSDAAGQAGLELAFDQVGTDLLATWTPANLERQLALVVDGQVIAAPTLMGTITDGRMMLSGPPFAAQANEWLAALLDSGPLRLALEEISIEPAETVPCPEE